MENYFDQLDIETINAIKNCTNEVPDNEIYNFLQLSCKDCHLMDFMYDECDANDPEIDQIFQDLVGLYITYNMTRGDDTLYTVTNDVTKKIKNLNVMKE